MQLRHDHEPRPLQAYPQRHIQRFQHIWRAACTTSDLDLTPYAVPDKWHTLCSFHSFPKRDIL